MARVSRYWNSPQGCDGMSRVPRKGSPALAVVPAAEPRPVPEVIAALEALLIDAKAGRIRGLAAAFVTPDANFTGSTSGVGVGDVLTAKLLEAGIEELRHEFHHAIRGR